MEGSPLSIHCTKETQKDIYRHLTPPFEELFDEAEEYILEVLFAAWSQMIMLDLTAFDKVSIANNILYSHTSSRKYIDMSHYVNLVFVQSNKLNMDAARPQFVNVKCKHGRMFF